MTRSEWIAFIVVAALIAVFGVVSSGCTGQQVMIRYHQSVATAAIAASGCREVLSDAHEKKTTAIEVKARLGDVAGAKAAREEWMPIYSKIKTACVALKTGAETGLASAPVVEAAINKQKDALAWIARLAKLGAEVIAALAEAGLKLPEATP